MTLGFDGILTQRHLAYQLKCSIRSVADLSLFCLHFFLGDKMRKILLIFGICFGLSGCAEGFLEDGIRSAEGQGPSLRSYDQVTNSSFGINGAIQLAFRMADGYAKAGRRTAISQDMASFALIGAAGWTAVGVADDLANDILAERVVSAVATERVVRRGVPRSAITALYEGASRHNCVAMAGSLYRRVDMATLTLAESNAAVPEDFAAFLMVLTMREIEYRTFSGLARELESFSSLVSSFNNAVVGVGQPGDETDADIAAAGDGPVGLTQNPALERFFRILTGCLQNPADDAPIVPDTSGS